MNFAKCIFIIIATCKKKPLKNLLAIFWSITFCVEVNFKKSKKQRWKFLKTTKTCSQNFRSTYLQKLIKINELENKNRRLYKQPSVSRCHICMNYHFIKVSLWHRQNSFLCLLTYLLFLFLILKPLLPFPLR